MRPLYKPLLAFSHLRNKSGVIARSCEWSAKGCFTTDYFKSMDTVPFDEHGTVLALNHLFEALRIGS